MAVNARHHSIQIDDVDETNEGGLHHYRWSCFCRRNGQWTTDKEAAERNGAKHVRVNSPKRPADGPAAVRKLLSLL